MFTFQARQNNIRKIIMRQCSWLDHSDSWGL